MKADSGRRAAARRIAAAAAALPLLAGCGGGGSKSAAAPARTVDELQGVAAHRLADAPARNRPAAWRGPHPVTVRRLSVARDGLYGRWYAPKDLRAETPGLVVFGGSKGGLRTTALARAFASYGYPALALAYFKARGLPRELRRIPLEYFRRALLYVSRQPRVDRVVAWGASRGGEAALLLGATYPKLVRGVVAIVPDYQVNPGWTLHGRPIPYDSEIPVERISGPVLTASGGNDRIWSSSVYTEQIELRLDDADFPFPHRRLDYPREGHGLSGVQADLWRQTRAFMRRLREAPPAPARGS